MMETLISWSGIRSRNLARELRDWLPSVLQRVEPWMSDKDIYAGARWAGELGTHLANIDFGIVCVTPESSKAPWVLFEAGALAKSLDFGRVVPVLLEMKSTDLEGPLSQFQSVEANNEGMRSLILSLNQALPDKDRMTDERTTKIFDIWWPELERRISEIQTERSTESIKPTRTDRQLLEEILEISRQVQGQRESESMPTVSDMLAALTIQKERLDRRESGIQAAEVSAERGGLDDSDPHLLSIREAMSDTWHEQQLYNAAIKALTAIASWRPRHSYS